MKFVQVQLREFEDNKQLLEKLQEIKEFDGFIRLEEEKLGNCSVNELMQQKNSLKKEKEIFDKEVILNNTCRWYLLNYDNDNNWWRWRWWSLINSFCRIISILLLFNYFCNILSSITLSSNLNKFWLQWKINYSLFDNSTFAFQMDILKTRNQKLEGEISALKDELSSKSLADAEKKYRDKVISLRVCFFFCQL